MQRRERLRFFVLGLLPAFAVGSALRLVGVRAQMLADDELHTVGAVLAMPVGEIIRTVTYEGADYCVPLTALFRWLMDRGVVFSELGFRVPALLAGFAALILIPKLLAPRIGRSAAVLCAWLLAISPMLVLYSRMVRPYMIVTLLAFAAVMSFDAWLRSRSRVAAGSYVGLAAISVYLHLGAGPFVLAPFAYLTFDLVRRRPSVEELRPAALLAVATACAIALPLLPAFDSLVELTQIRRDGRFPPLATWLEVVQLQAGTRSAALAALVSGVALRGGWLLRKRDPVFLGLISSLALVQLVGLVLLSPDRMQEASVLNRYLLILLPFGLALVAVALADLLERAPSTSVRAAFAACVAGLLALLFATGPLASRDYSASAFTHTPSFLRLTQPADRIAGEHVPAFYHELASRPDATIVEHPWMRQSSHAFSAYQNVHHQPVLLSSLVEGYHDPRLDLRNVLQPSSADLLASRARYLVVHLDLRSEAGRVETGDLHHGTWLRARAQLWEPLRRSGQNTAVRLTREWGPPFYADEAIEVWDLDAVRSERKRSR